MRAVGGFQSLETRGSQGAQEDEVRTAELGQWWGLEYRPFSLRLHLVKT